MQFRGGFSAFILPGGNIHVIGIVPLGFPFLCLAFNTEMSTAGFLPLQGVNGHQLSNVKEIFKPESLFQFLVEFILNP